jgi:hypothetical protein
MGLWLVARGRKHLLKHLLGGHGVRAPAVGLEELTITVKNTPLESDGVITVVAFESQGKLVEAKALRLLGVVLCFLDLADHSIVHVVLSPFASEVWGEQKARKRLRALRALNGYALLGLVLLGAYRRFPSHCN